MNRAIVVLPFIFVSLNIAVWSGWLRMGWSLPSTVAAAQHGAVMVGSFLSTLIFLERAVTFRTKWILAVPFVNGLSIIFFLFQKPTIALLMLIVGSAGFLLMCAWFIYKHRELYYYVFFAGAFCLLTGNLVAWKTLFYPNAVNWWISFLFLTIVAERLELSRFLNLSTFKRILLVGLLALLVAALFIPFHSWGRIMFSVSIAATALWLLQNDMARRAVKAKGQHRYSALLLLTGYVWLLASAFLFLFSDRFVLSYDASLHAFFVGFVFSMIFSHAPIILPAVLKWPIQLYRPILYAWFILLQLSLIVRITADILSNNTMKMWGGLVNGIAIILFFITVIVVVRQEVVRHRLSKS